MSTKNTKAMQIANPYYQESGSFKPAGLALAIAVILLVTFGLGYVYTILMMFIPIIYANVLVVIGYGIGLGWLVKMLSRLTHNRNAQSRLILALIAGVAANYFQWVGFLVYAAFGETPPFSAYALNADMILYPVDTFSFISEINAIGMWEIFGISFEGILLAIVWLIEFGIILVLPILAVKNMKIIPYAENAGKWYPRYTLDNDFAAVSSKSTMVGKLTDNALATLQNLGTGDGFKHTKVHVYHLDNEPKNYLDLERALMVDREKGKMEHTIFIDNLAIDRTDAKAILDTFQHKKSRTELI